MARFEIDDQIIARLPLPIAKAARGVADGRNPLDRQLSAYFMWEAGLKLLASVAIVNFLRKVDDEPTCRDYLADLSRPSLGHWWSFVRRLTAYLADDGDPQFARIRELLFSAPKDSFPRSAGLLAILNEYLTGQSGARARVSLSKLFDQLVAYRNRELGHGATGRQSDEFYDSLASAMLAAMVEISSELDFLAGRRLVLTGDVRRASGGEWLVDVYELLGERPKRQDPVSYATQEECVFRPNHIYVAASLADSQNVTPLTPLASFDTETREYFTYNGRKGANGLEYLCHTTGNVIRSACESTSYDQLDYLLKITSSSPPPEADKPGDDDQPVGAGQGQMLGEYELISELGRGGMGIVYRAWQPSLGRQVAIKRIFKVGDTIADRRFAREIRALAHVDHPNVVKALTSGSHGDQWFLVMELVEGADLTAVCAHLNEKSAAEIDEETWTRAISVACEESRTTEVPLSTASGEQDAGAGSGTRAYRSLAAAPQALRGSKTYVRRIVEIMHTVTQATYELHAKGIIHRDIKPGNIRITPSGEPVLMDLGVAQLIDESEGRLTRTRQSVGTLRYMSPEQMLAVGNIDLRADIYSLGATLSELLTLSPLFDATDDVPDAEVMQRIQLSEPGSLRRRNASVPRDLESIVLKCLRKDRNQRYSTAYDLAADLQRFLAGEPVSAQPLSVRYIAGKAIKKYRWPLATAALVGLALSIGALMFVINLNDQRKSALEANQRLEEEAYVKNIAVAERELTLNQDFDLAYALLEQCSESLRGWEWHYLKRLWQTNDTQPLAGHARGLWMADYHPDGKLLVTCSIDGTFKVWDVDQKSVVFSINAEPEPIVASTNSLLDGLARSVPLRPVLQLFGMPNIPITGVAYSPNGARIAAASFAPKIDVEFSGALTPDYSIDNDNSPGVVSLWDPQTRQKVGEFRDQFGVVLAMTYSPDGTQIASSSMNRDNSFVVWDAETCQTIKKVTGHENTVHSIRYAPHEKMIATADSIGIIKLWDSETLAELRSFRAHPAGIMDMSFSPDGKYLASAGLDGTIRVWNTSSWEMVRSQKGHIGSALGVCYSPDGKRIVSAGFDQTVRVWDAASGQEQITLRGHTEGIWGVDFSPDGNQIVSASFDDSARIWDATPISDEIPNVKYSLVGHSDRVNAVVYNNEGSLLASSSWDNDIRLWDAETGKEINHLPGHAGAVWGLAFSPDSKWLASASWDKTIKLWDVSTGQEVATFEGHTAAVHSLAFSHQGDRIVTGGYDGQIIIWNIPDGEIVAKCDGTMFPVFSVAFSPDDRMVASGGVDRRVILWDASDGAKLKTVGEHEASVQCVAFDPKGQYLAAASWDKTVKVWNLPDDAQAEPELLTMFAQHTDIVNSVTFSPDSGVVASASQDKTVRLWNVTTGLEVCRPLKHPGYLWSVRFHPTASSIATGCWSEHGWIWVWDYDGVVQH